MSSEVGFVQLIVDVLAAAFVGYGAFKWYGKRWLEARFAKKLEDHKAKINSFLSRVSKIYEKEFEVLPEAWRRLHDALGHVDNLAKPLKEHLDINGLSKEKLEEFMADAKLQESVKQELRTTTDKTAIYKEIVFWKQVERAGKAIEELHNYLIYNKIFLDTELYKKFSEVDSHLYSSVLDQELGEQYKDRKMKLKYYKETRKLIMPLMEEIEILVQKKLHYPESQGFSGNPIG